MSKSKKDKCQMTSYTFGVLGSSCLIISNLLKLTIGDTLPVVVIRGALTLAALVLVTIQIIYAIKFLKLEKLEKSKKHI